MSYAEGTTVPFDKSIGELITLLKKKGGGQIVQAELDHEYVLQFSISDRMIRFRLPFLGIDKTPVRDGRGSTLSASTRMAKLAQSKRQRGRALLLVVKAKLESVESGIETIEEAFLANVVMSDGKTVYDRIAGPVALEYAEGRPSNVAGLLAGPGDAA